MSRYILLLATLFMVGSCTVTGPSIPRNEYDSDFYFYAKKINKGRNKVKFVEGIERNFRLANEKDIHLTDTLRQLNEPKQWPVINHIYRRIQARQTALSPLLPIKAKNGYKPELPMVANIDQLESESRIKAADYLYERAELLLSLAASGNHTIARDAYFTLENLNKNYIADWRQTDSLLLSAKETGTTRILLQEQHWGFFHEFTFWDHLNRYNGFGYNSTWQVVDKTPVEGRKYHYSIELHLSNLSTGWEQRSETEQSYSKEIQTGEKVVRDSSGQVVERSPIMETIKGSIKEVRITKEATAVLWVKISDFTTGEEVQNIPIYASESFDQTWVSTSGDERALPSLPISTGFGFPSAPSDWEMVEELASQMRFRLSNCWSHL